MLKIKKGSMLLYGIAAIFFIWLLCRSLFQWHEANVNFLPIDEIVASGHRYLVFGSQHTNGIELYDVKQQRFIHFLEPAEKGFIYRDPVVGASGKGVCVKHVKIFNSDSGGIDLISFDLNTLQSKFLGKLPMKKYETSSLSPDEKKLAIVCATSLDSPYLVTIYNIAARKVEKAFSVEKLKTPIKIVWKSDSNVVLWSNLMDGPQAIDLDIKTGRLLPINDFPLDVKGNYMLALDDKRESVYWQNLKSGEKQIIVKKNSTGHSFSLSQNGKYVVFGWLRGLGAETLTIVEVNSKRKFQLKTTEGAVLGSALW